MSRPGIKVMVSAVFSGARTAFGFPRSPCLLEVGVMKYSTSFFALVFTPFCAGSPFSGHRFADFRFRHKQTMNATSTAAMTTVIITVTAVKVITLSPVSPRLTFEADIPEDLEVMNLELKSDEVVEAGVFDSGSEDSSSLRRGEKRSRCRLASNSCPS